MDNYNIDKEAFNRELEAFFVFGFLNSLLPDQEDSRKAIEVLKVFLRHGVDIKTAHDILLELEETTSKEDQDE